MSVSRRLRDVGEGVGRVIGGDEEEISEGGDKDGVSLKKDSGSSRRSKPVKGRSGGRKEIQTGWTKTIELKDHYLMAEDAN